MNDLLIGLLSALMATNQPAAVSNLVQKKTGVKIEIADPNDPVEQAYRQLMVDDDAADDEVNRWVEEGNKAGKNTDIDAAALRARIRERYDKVKKAYEDFLEAHPRHAKARIAYGSFLNDLGEEQSGEAQWEKAREIDPKNPAVWNNLANFNGHSGDVKKSFEYYAKAIELDPNEAVYYQNFGTTVFLFRKDAMEFYKITEQQVFEKAMALYRRALELDPNNFLLAADVAQTYYGIKPPKFDNATSNRLAEVKLAEEALTAWHRALGLAGDDVQREGVQVHLARWQMTAGRLEEARQTLSAITNSVLDTTKARLLKKLSSLDGTTTNVAPKSVIDPAAKPRP